MAARTGTNLIDRVKYWIGISVGVFKPFLVVLILFSIFCIIAFGIPIAIIYCFWNMIVSPAFGLQEITLIQTFIILLAFILIKIFFFNTVGVTTCRQIRK